MGALKYLLRFGFSMIVALWLVSGGPLIAQETSVPAETTNEQSHQQLEHVGVYGGKGFETEQLYNPSDVSVSPDGRIYVTDTSNHQIKIYKIKIELVPDGVIGGYGEQEGRFNKPTSVAFDRQGRLVVTDMMNNRVQIFDRNGKLVKCFGQYGRKPGELANPMAVEVDDKDQLIVTDMNHRLSMFDEEGHPLSYFGAPGKAQGQFNFPKAITYDPNSKLIYLADSNNDRIQVVSQEGLEKVIGPAIKGLPNPLLQPSGLAIQGDWLIISDSGNNRLVIIDKKNCQLIGTYGREGDKVGEFMEPQGLAILNFAGFVVVDRHNHRIQILKLKEEAK